MSAKFMNSSVNKPVLTRKREEPKMAKHLAMTQDSGISGSVPE
jgi:hypothetical protein